MGACARVQAFEVVCWMPTIQEVLDKRAQLRHRLFEGRYHWVPGQVRSMMIPVPAPVECGRSQGGVRMRPRGPPPGFGPDPQFVHPIIAAQQQQATEVVDILLDEDNGSSYGSARSAVVTAAPAFAVGKAAVVDDGSDSNAWVPQHAGMGPAADMANGAVKAAGTRARKIKCANGSLAGARQRKMTVACEQRFRKWRRHAAAGRGLPRDLAVLPLFSGRRRWQHSVAPRLVGPPVKNWAAVKMRSFTPWVAGRRRSRPGCLEYVPYVHEWEPKHKASSKQAGDFLQGGGPGSDDDGDTGSDFEEFLAAFIADQEGGGDARSVAAGGLVQSWGLQNEGDGLLTHAAVGCVAVECEAGAVGGLGDMGAGGASAGLGRVFDDMEVEAVAVYDVGGGDMSESIVEQLRLWQM